MEGEEEPPPPPPDPNAILTSMMENAAEAESEAARVSANAPAAQGGAEAPPTPPRPPEPPAPAIDNNHDANSAKLLATTVLANAGVKAPLYGSPRGSNEVFVLKTISRVEKKHKTGGLDYWTYFINCETNLPGFMEEGRDSQKRHEGRDGATGGGGGGGDPPRPAGGGEEKKGKDREKPVVIKGGTLQVERGRRYREFEWLREVLAVENPGVIVPPLPGLAVEGMLDKMDALLGQDGDEEFPALVTFRMRGLTLFLKWIVKSKRLRESKVMQKFVVLTHEELKHYQHHGWKEDKREFDRGSEHKNTMLFKMRKSFNAPKGLDPFIVKTRTGMHHAAGELRILKEHIDKLWDSLAQLSDNYGEPGKVPPPKESDLTDEVLKGISKVTKQVKMAVHTFSESNEALFVSIVVDITFAAGLCHSVRDVADRLSEMQLLLEGGQKGSKEAPPIQEVLNQATATYKEEFKHFTLHKAPLYKRMAFNMARLCSSLDPVNFDWKRRCSSAINSIPDPDGWGEEEDIDVDSGATGGGDPPGKGPPAAAAAAAAPS